MNLDFEGFQKTVNSGISITFVKIDNDTEYFDIVESDNGYYVFNYYEKGVLCHVYVTQNYEEMVYELIPNFLKSK